MAFNASQDLLDRTLGGINTIALVLSGWSAAVALKRVRAGGTGRFHLGLAMSLGLCFLGVKVAEYAAKAQAGIGIETDTFFTLYFLITGFHALHVVMGIAVLGIVSWKNSLDNVETGTAFWHMIDVIWVLIYPIIYLLR